MLAELRIPLDIPDIEILKTEIDDLGIVGSDAMVKFACSLCYQIPKNDGEGVPDDHPS